MNWIEGIEKSALPFVYGSSKLNDEKYRKAIKKIGVEGTVLGAIVGDGFMGPEGLAVTEEGIWFSFFNATTGTGIMTRPKTKGVFLFDSFQVHSVTVKKGFSSFFDVEFVMFDLKEAKSLIFTFKLLENNLTLEEAMNQELKELFNTLVSETDTEHTEITDIFDFITASKLGIRIQTTITLTADDIVITKRKFDKTNIETPIGTPVTFSRSAVASVKKRMFSPLPILIWSLTGIILCLIFVETFSESLGGFMVIIGFIIGILAAFSKKLIIKRKDGKKYIIPFHGSDINNRNYNMLINVIFK
jgi:hypothetical protein